MNLKSIRFRLTLWYSGAFLLSTAVIYAAFFLINRQTLFYQTDQTITAHAETMIKIISDEQPSMMTGAFNQGIISQQFIEMPGMLVLVTNEAGQIIANSQVGAETSLVIKTLIERSANIIKPTFVERSIGSTTLRIGVFPITKDNVITGQLFMGDPIEAIYHSLDNLLLTLVVIYVLFSVPTVVGSYFLAKRILRPISAVSTELKTITDKNLNKQVEIPQTGDELAELATTFNDVLKRLHGAFDRERQFISDVAHELKTPLATLQGEVEVALAKKRTTGEYQQTLNEVLTDTNRISKTIKNILDLAWVGADTVQPIKDEFNFSNAALELREIAVKLAQKKHLKITGEIQPKIYIHGSEDKISRAILNLLDNAIKFTPTNGSVKFSLQKNRLCAVVEVKDTGVGIPDEEQAHIFERFYRGAKTAKTLGSGLGLAIAQGIVTAHGGSIEVASRVGRGTTVTIFLPLS